MRAGAPEPASDAPAGPPDPRRVDRPAPNPPWTVGGRAAPPDVRIDPDEARASLRAFHRIRRRMLWSWRGPGHLAVTVLVTIGRPVKLVERLLTTTRRAAPEVRRRWGVPVRRQVWDQLRIFARWGLQPYDYYQSRLFEPGRMATAPFQMHPFDTAEIFGGYLGWGNFGFDKHEFAVRAEAAGLPVIPVLASCLPGGKPVVHLPDSPAWEGDLFTKRVTGGRGLSQRRWRRLPDGGISDGRDRLESVDDLLAFLCVPKRKRPRSAEIVQPCLVNHELIREATGGGGLSTVRVVTVQPGKGRGPEAMLPVAKFAVGDSPVDNMARGGLVAPVDLATGRLGPVRRSNRWGFVEPAEAHPDTGRRLEGLVLPDWERVLDLCLEGQRVFDEMPSLGWDVALTPDGPVLVEANVMWGAVDLQDWPHGLTPYPRWTAEWLGEALARRADERGRVVP